LQHVRRDATRRTDLSATADPCSGIGCIALLSHYCEVSNFNGSYGSWSNMYVTVPNFMAISQTVAKIWAALQESVRKFYVLITITTKIRVTLCHWSVTVVLPVRKMAFVRHVRHFEFSYFFCNFNCCYSSEWQNTSSCQILWRSIKLLLRYGHLTVFKMAAVCHL